MSAPRPVVQGLLQVTAEQAEAAREGREVVRVVRLSQLHKCEASVSGTGLWESLRALALVGEEAGADVMLVSDAAFATEERILEAWSRRGVAVAHRVGAPRRIEGALVTLATLEGASTAPSPKPVRDVLRALYALVAVSRTEAALAQLWGAFDDARLDGAASWGEELLRQLAFERVNAEVLVGALSASRLLGEPVAAARARFQERVEEALRERSTRDAGLARLLARLRP